MPALTFKIFLFFYFYLSDMLSMLCVVVYPVICQAPNLEQHTERTLYVASGGNIQRQLLPELLPLEAVSEKKGGKCGP